MELEHQAELEPTELPNPSDTTTTSSQLVNPSPPKLYKPLEDVPVPPPPSQAQVEEGIHKRGEPQSCAHRRVQIAPSTSLRPPFRTATFA